MNLKILPDNFPPSNEDANRKQKGIRSMNLQRSTLLVLVLLLALSGTAGADTISWNVASGTWNTAANWNPSTAVPTTTDDAVINNNGTASLDLGGNYPHIGTYEVASQTIGSGSVLQKDDTSSSRYLKVTGAWINNGTIRHSQGSGFLGLNLSTSTGNANTGTIRADGREIRLGGNVNDWELNNAGGVIEAINGGTIKFSSPRGDIEGGSLTTDTASTIDNGAGNGSNIDLIDVAVNNAGTFQSLGTYYSRYLTFSTSGGLTSSGTAKVSISANGVKQGMTFNSGTTLNNSGTFTIENIRTSTTATSESYLDLKAGSTLINSGTIEVKSQVDTYGTVQLRSAIDFSNPGIITVDGAFSSIQMSGKALTQTAGTLDVKNGGSVVAATVAIDGGTLAGNGSIFGNVTLASAVTRGWAYAAGVGGVMAVSGTLTLPAAATVTVSGSGTFPEPATLFTATSLAGETSLSGWTVTGVNGYVAKIDGTSVVLVKSNSGTIILLR